MINIFKVWSRKTDNGITVVTFLMPGVRYKVIHTQKTSSLIRLIKLIIFDWILLFLQVYLSNHFPQLSQLHQNFPVKKYQVEPKLGLPAK